MHLRRLALATAAALLALPTASMAGTQPIVERPLELQVGGQRATGLVFEPAGLHDPTQLLVFAHGHGEIAASFRDVLTRLVAETGVPAVAMDYRGPAGAWNVGAGADDTVAATRWYQGLHPTVTDTVLWGWSMGGMISGIAAARAPELYRTWVASFGAFNAPGAWALFSVLGLPDREELERDAGCSFPDCPDRYVERSPSLLASRIRVRRAILLHAVGDTTSPYEQSREMQAALLSAQIPVSFYTFLTAAGDGTPSFAGHGRGVVGTAAFAVVERVLAGAEPDSGPNLEYVVDGRTGIDTGPG